MNQELPKDIEAEQLCLSCVLMDTDVLARCMEAKVTASSFYDQKHGIIFDAALKLHGDQVPVSVETVAVELRTTKQIDVIGGWGFLSQVSTCAPTTAHARVFIERVRTMHRLREVIRGANALAQAAYSFSGEWEDLKSQMDKISEAFNEQAAGRSWKASIDEAEAITRERMKPPADRKLGNQEISWGIPDFDKYFQPIEPGELIIIGGYTSSGKSSLLRQIAWNVAKGLNSSLISTIEVRDTEEAINLAAHASGHRSRSRLHEMHERDQADLLKSFDTMRLRTNFAVSHQDTSWAGMAARARAFKRRHGLKFFGADYLQIMDEVKELQRDMRPDFAIGVVTSKAKKFATTEETAVCLLSGFNREYIKRNGEPKLSDLEGSSNIEKDASRVLLLHIPEEYAIGGSKFTQSLIADPDEQPRFFVKIIQAKGRNQGTSSVGMFFQRETKTFMPIQK